MEMGPAAMDWFRFSSEAKGQLFRGSAKYAELKP